MPLQLLEPFQTEDVDVLFEQFKGYYQDEGERVGQATTQEETYERIVFAIISVNSPFNATCKAWEKVKEVENGNKWGIYHALHTPGSDGVVSYAATKASWIGRLWFDAFENGMALTQSGMS